MIKAMLLGDSIRLGYQDAVRNILQGQAEVHAPEENCRFAGYTLFSLMTWVPDDDYDVVHWNNGQWDVCYMPDGRIHTSLTEYVDREKRIAEILRRKAERLVFATTTPVHADQYDTAVRNPRTNEDIMAYNSAVSRELSAMGVEINDLYTPLAEDVTRYVSEDKVHLSPAGVEVCAARVSDAILNAVP